MAARILVVEDDEASRYIYGALLTPRGYDVSIHADPLAALSDARSEPPTLVITDIGLDGMDGIELTRRLRSEDSTSHIPIIVVTVHAFEPERNAATAAGATLFMTKPADWTEFLKHVDALAGAPAAPDSNGQAQ